MCVSKKEIANKGLNSIKTHSAKNGLAMFVLFIILVVFKKKLGFSREKQSLEMSLLLTKEGFDAETNRAIQTRRIKS